MSKRRLLDLFCGAGGCSMGYYRAGFDVVGVDIKPQPHYPFEFIQADALTFPLDEFDVIHASPPCQAYSAATVQSRLNGGDYPDLLGITREILQQSGKPWIIENVPGAPIQSGIILCGSMFDLRVRRHRHFESSFLLLTSNPCRHDNAFVSVWGGAITRTRFNPAYTGPKCGVRQKIFINYPLEIGQKAMGIDWMNAKELSQAIPPAYTEYIGKEYLRILQENVA